jgi:two-component system cell cycle response regulator DivK
MKKKVLIVEDYEDSRTFLKFLVESYGYEVFEAQDGIEALDSFKKHHPDIVLMDISLPMVDGLITTKAIRECDDTGEVPIIAITAFGKSYYKKAIEAGCNDLISKPLDIGLLESMLSNHLMPVFK